jgi:hypothetical protein
MVSSSPDEAPAHPTNAEAASRSNGKLTRLLRNDRLSIPRLGRHLH